MTTLTEELTVEVGKTFQVPLVSNATTGFQWRLVSASGPLRLQDSTYTAPGATDPDTGRARVGASGQTTFTFVAQSSGQHKIVLDYARPWAGSGAPAKRIIIAVTAQTPTPDPAPEPAPTPSAT
jgi:predicted secreted protein